MADWVRRSFDSFGVTQYRPGPHLDRIVAIESGHVILCIDVSGSMAGERIRHACTGAQRFLREARENAYSVALLAWDHGVAGYWGFDSSAEALDAKLEDGLPICGGTDIAPALRQCFDELAELDGDRVVAVFGDGDLGNVSAADAAAAQLTSRGIRILTLGLGDQAAAALDRISTERRASPRAAEVDGLADGIATMAHGLMLQREP